MPVSNLCRIPRQQTKTLSIRMFLSSLFCTHCIHCILRSMLPPCISCIPCYLFSTFYINFSCAPSIAFLWVTAVLLIVYTHLHFQVLSLSSLSSQFTLHCSIMMLSIDYNISIMRRVKKTKGERSTLRWDDQHEVGSGLALASPLTMGLCFGSDLAHNRPTSWQQRCSNGNEVSPCAS